MIKNPFQFLRLGWILGVYWIKSMHEQEYAMLIEIEEKP